MESYIWDTTLGRHNLHENRGNPGRDNCRCLAGQSQPVKRVDDKQGGIHARSQRRVAALERGTQVNRYCASASRSSG